MRIVHYGNDLTYFEAGRVEFLRQQGLPVSEVDQQIPMPVVQATVRSVTPARLDDLLEVRCWDPATSRMIAIPPWLQAMMTVVPEGPPARV